MDIKTKRILTGLAGVTGTLWLGLTAGIAARQQQLIFNPVRQRTVSRPRSDGHRTRPVVLRAADGTRLSGWLMIPRSRGTHPAVIYFGGRSEEVSWVARDAGTMFPDMAVLAINYRGYGDSHGEPAERHMIADGQMLFDWLAAHKHFDAARIAVVGRSLGSGVAVQLATHRPVAAVALITPYDSILALAKRRFWSMLPLGLMLRHRFESIRHAEKISAPVLVLRAETDDVVPHSHTDLLVAKFAAAPRDETIPASNHGDIPFLPAAQKCIADFLQHRFLQLAPAMSASEVGLNEV